MGTNRKISELGTVSPAARDDVFTLLDPTTNKKGLASDYLALTQDTDITFSDVTTGDVSTTKHGYMPKLPSGVPGVLLGLVAYAAGSDTTLHTQSTNTMTDMDASNVLVTFVVPASGAVLIRASVLGSNNAAGDHYFGLRESTTTIATVYAAGQVPTGSVANRLTVTFVLTGLVAGAIHTYKLAHRVTSGSVSVFTGPTFGQAIMEVWAAP